MQQITAAEHWRQGRMNDHGASASSRGILLGLNRSNPLKKLA